LKLLRSFPSSKNRSQPGRKLRQKVRDISRETFTNSKSDSLGRRLLGPFKNVRAKSFIQKVTQKKEPPQKYHPKRATLFKRAGGQNSTWYNWKMVTFRQSLEGNRNECHPTKIHLPPYLGGEVVFDVFVSRGSEKQCIQVTIYPIHAASCSKRLDAARFWSFRNTHHFHVRKVHPTWFQTKTLEMDLLLIHHTGDRGILMHGRTYRLTSLKALMAWQLTNKLEEIRREKPHLRTFETCRK